MSERTPLPQCRNELNAPPISSRTYVEALSEMPVCRRLIIWHYHREPFNRGGIEQEPAAIPAYQTCRQISRAA